MKPTIQRARNESAAGRLAAQECTSKQSEASSAASSRPGEQGLPELIGVTDSDLSCSWKHAQTRSAASFHEEMDLIHDALLDAQEPFNNLYYLIRWDPALAELAAAARAIVEGTHLLLETVWMVASNSEELAERYAEAPATYTAWHGLPGDDVGSDPRRSYDFKIPLAMRRSSGARAVADWFVARSKPLRDLQPTLRMLYGLMCGNPELRQESRAVRAIVEGYERLRKTACDNDRKVD